ncbi:MAG: UDP-N-acetylmuramoyl-tripeptide--D-alanyl-D-alanine ligase [Prolixibacteraceae bacterium]|nr:UDP-N-acetylmuramoyl-tripeptide--D-alanyl-D-alanine ligase [Prolixibacteraceae bacterium]
MMKAEQIYACYLQNPAIVTDSRKAVQGTIFFALKGENFNGNDFASAALKNNASYAVVDEQPAFSDSRLIVVDNALATLQQLAVFHRRKLQIPIIAITGTNGKTTTKELTTAVLAQKYKVQSTQGNLNNHIGVPLTLLSFKPNIEIGVVEMGANHLGEIDFLCRIAQPNYGLITNVGKAHLQGFGDMEGVIRAKSELYRYLESKNGTVFINGENQHLKTVAGNRLTKIFYGNSENSRLHCETTGAHPFLKLRIGFPSETIELETQLAGVYNFENVMAAAAIGAHFDVSPEMIKTAIQNYFPSNNRSQLVKTDTNKILLDAYNANPTSMAASIKNFLAIDDPDKIMVLGDMLELGDSSPAEHQHIIDLLTNSGAPQVFLVGEQFGKTRRPSNFRIFDSAACLAAFLAGNVISGKLILIKGSRGIGLEKIMDVL